MGIHDARAVVFRVVQRLRQQTIAKALWQWQEAMKNSKQEAGVVQQAIQGALRSALHRWETGAEWQRSREKQQLSEQLVHVTMMVSTVAIHWSHHGRGTM